MLRNRAVALILGCTVSTLTFALGLGPLQSDSHLNEPFAGRIPILGATAEDFDALKISLASIEQFERAGLDDGERELVMDYLMKNAADAK